MKKIILASVVLGIVAAGQVQAASYPLYAGRATEVGTVDVTSDGTSIYVTFNTTDGWVLGATEVHIAGSLEGIPHTRCGIPMLWRFAGRHGWLRCAGNDTYTFPIGELGGEDVYVVAHAIVARMHRRCLQVEEAWAGEDQLLGRSRARYIAIAADQWVSSGSGWSVTGDWTFMLFDGLYQHDLSLEQDADGAITGTGALMAGDPPAPAQNVTVTGNLTDDTITLTLVYPDSGGFSFTIEGTIADDGTLSGTCPELFWSWSSTSGAAQEAGGLWTLP
jgi:hypothetical protein